MSEKTLLRQVVKIVFLCVCWYSISATNNVLMKQIFQVFPRPMTLTMVHLLAICAFLGPTLTVLNVDPTPYISRRFFFRIMVPLALGKLFASLSGHVSILKVPLSYAHTVKAVMPIFTMFLSLIILKERFPCKVYLSLIPIVIGVFIATVTELSFDAMGLVAALIATLCIALQNIYSKKCLRDVRIHHLRLLLVLCQIASVLLFPVWMYTDVWDIITQLHKVQSLGWLLFVLPVDGLLSFGQNVVAFSLISAISPVSYAVANSTKRIVVIGVSLLMLRNPVTPYNVCGMLIAIAGVALYNKLKYDSSKAKKKTESLLPTAAAAPYLGVSDMHVNSEAYHVDHRSSHSPLRII